MATTDARIFRINDYIAAINPAQIAVEPANDADLGYRMYGGKDAAGNVQKWLAKDKPARIDTLQLIGADTVSEAGLLRHDSAGNVTGKLMTVAELNALLSDGPIGGVSEHNSLTGLQGGAVGEYLHLTDTEYTSLQDMNALTAGYILFSDGSAPTGEAGLFWDTTNNNLLLNEPTITSTWTSLVINGSGAKNTLEVVNSSFVLGDGNDLDDTSYSRVIGAFNSISGEGNFHDVSGYDNTVQGDANCQYAMGYGCLASAAYSRVYGLTSTVSNAHAEARGVGASSVWPGAEHFTGGQLNGDYSSQGMDGMILQARTTDDTNTIMKFNASDSDSPLWCPDECIQTYIVELLISTDQAGAGAKEGFAWYRFPIVVMRTEPDFNAYMIQSKLETIQIRGDGETLGSWGIQVDDTDNVVEIEVIGHASPFTTINWLVHVRAGLQLHTDFYVSGTGG